MNKKKYYVYEWYNKITEEVFYVGKGCGNRYKETNRRNKLFKEYYANNDVDVRIVSFFDEEEAAYECEKKITEQYREKGQCECNLIDGGYGGYSSVWSETARHYKSVYNPMKDEKQRKRMSKRNPMKNPDVAKRISEQHKKIICIGDKMYNGWGEAAAAFGLSTNNVGFWLEKGYAPNHEPCYYLGDDVPNFTVKKCGQRKAIYVDDIYFESLEKAGEYLGCTNAAISYAIKHSGKCKNHICRYADS